jgi:phosphomannomutase / phosphoglucomutase
MIVNEEIFRDYDIRGIVGTDLNEAFAIGIGKAFGTYLIQKGVTEALVGYDARESSPSYFEKSVEGMLSTGVNVTKIGMVTSPMMYWARKYYKIDGGLAVTASHNPPEYNGFKAASGNGALYGEEIQKIMGLMISEKFLTGQGRAVEKEIYEDYYRDIENRINISRPLSVIVDCGNSTAGPFAPTIIERLGVTVKKLYCDIDPKFPNHPPDPVNPKAYPDIVKLIREAKPEGKYHLGLLFDGDADRLGAVDEDGTVVRGDQITALCARHILRRKPNAKILFELQSSKSATDDVEGHGGEVVLTRVGHSYIEEALSHEKGELAGETSGHVFFADNWYGFDDAIYAACRLLEYIAESGQTLKALVESLPKYYSTPQTRVFAPDDRKFVIVKELQAYFKSKNYKVLTIDGVRLEFKDGWAVVRASNTQPQLTMRAEATNKASLNEIKAIVVESLAPYFKDGLKVVWGKV